jgi:hypothetical protein
MTRYIAGRDTHSPRTRALITGIKRAKKKADPEGSAKYYKELPDSDEFSIRVL